MIATSMTMAEAFRHVASGQPRREALVCGEARATYGQVVDRITALACGLDGLGVGKGDKVAAALSPGPEFVYLFFTLAELGAVMVPINPQLRPRQIDYLLRDSEPVAVVTSGWLGTAEGRRMIEDVQSEVPSLRHVISAEGGTGVHWCLADLLSTRPDSSFRPPGVSPDDLLALLYTSGTTGVPKGTMHSHRSLMTPVIASLKIRELWRIRPSLATMERFAKALARYGERLLRAAGRPQTLLSNRGLPYPYRVGSDAASLIDGRQAGHHAPVQPPGGTRAD